MMLRLLLAPFAVGKWLSARARTNGSAHLKVRCAMSTALVSLKSALMVEVKVAACHISAINAALVSLKNAFMVELKVAA